MSAEERPAVGYCYCPFVIGRGVAMLTAAVHGVKQETDWTGLLFCGCFFFSVDDGEKGY